MRFKLPMLKRFFFSGLCILSACNVFAQVSGITPDHVYMSNIRTVKFSPAGSPLSIPVLTLGGADQVVLGFDDLDADVKNYYYTLVLCNSDWKPAGINP